MRRVEKNEDYLRAEIRCDIANRGLTPEEWAKLKGFSAQFICDVLAGRRNVTDSLAQAMGYERRIIFVRSPSTRNAFNKENGNG